MRRACGVVYPRKRGASAGEREHVVRSCEYAYGRGRGPDERGDRLEMS